MPLRIILPLIFLIATLSFIQTGHSQSFNFDVEKLDPDGRPVQWTLGFNPAMLESYPVVVDSAIKHSGNYSLKLYNAKKEGSFGSCSINIPSIYSGKQIILKGFLKTENVSGSSGLWMRLDGQDGQLGFDNMSDRAVKGTNDWKQFTIVLPYSEDVQKIVVGALLIGGGAIWVDDLSVRIDNNEISSAAIKIKKVRPATLDTAFSKSSGLNFQINEQRQQSLTALGLVWGFLKYHHPAIAEGNYNWDAELIRIMPSVIAAANKNDWMAILEKWLDKLPAVPACKNCKSESKDAVKLSPDYGDLFKAGYLSTTLVDKLKFIQSNASNSFNYYISFESGVRNPKFTNENGYYQTAYPDAGIRLLALYRYWSMIQYFFPYRHLIKEDWNSVLPEFVPTFINAKDSTEYMLACLKLIAKVHDTHANVWGNNRTLLAYRGNYFVPFSTTFVEDNLVINNFYSDTAGIKNILSKGDIITHVDGQPVKEYIQQVLELTPASNYTTQLRSIQGFILRGKTNKITLTVLKNKKTETITLPRYEPRYLNFNVDYDPNPSDSSYKIINGDIGYVYPAKYKNTQLPAIINTFKNTKGIVVDMRCYPSDFMPFTFGNYIKANNSSFALFTNSSIQHPGQFVFQGNVANGKKDSDAYKNKVVVIVNEQSQSNAEYTTMAFQSSPNVKVIGSTTAGADGNVSYITLPGGVSTMISGIGVYYPDKSETQRVGVKIDLVVKPTLEGFRQGRDELLEKAIQMIRE